MPRRRKLLLLLPALQHARDRELRLIKYARFPPLSLLTLAGLTPEHWDVVVRDEHVEPVLLDEDFDLVGIQTYISSAYRAYELARTYRARGARVVLGGLHPTTLPDEAARHADAVCWIAGANCWRSRAPRSRPAPSRSSSGGATWANCCRFWGSPSSRWPTRRCSRR